MKGQFRLLLETVLLTAVIWTYADQASYETYSGVVAVRLATSPDMVAHINDKARGGSAEVVYLPMKLRGPKAAVRKLELERAAGASPFALSVAISDDLEPRVSHTRDIHDDVARMPAIRDRGLKLEELSGQTILFTLDRYVTVKLSVDVDAGKFGDALDGKPLVEPSTVAAKVLESELQKRGSPAQRLVIPIEEQIRLRAEDVTASFEALLGPKWEGMDAKFEPQQVRVTVRLVQSYRMVELSLIPLRVLMPPGVASADYEIEWQARADLLQNISVRMPIGKPQALDSTDVLAFISIDKSDLPDEPSPTATTAPAPTEGWSQREVHFVFPPGCGDVQVDGQRQVKFRVKKKIGGAMLAPSSDMP